MTTLKLYQTNVETVFDLLGDGEDDMTRALGWCLRESAPFLEKLGTHLGIDLGAESDQRTIHLQRHRKSEGRTDIELGIGGDPLAIIEAKRGYVLPSLDQLKTYAGRFAGETKSSRRALLVPLTMFDEAFVAAEHSIPDEIGGVAVRALSWRTVLKLARETCHGTRGTTRHYLDAFCTYLGGIIGMAKENSNLVRVVPLKNMEFAGGISFIEFVEKYDCYFHPIGGKGYLADPPNYFAFRVWGELKWICHVEESETIDDLGASEIVPGLPKAKFERPHFIHKLGPKIRPAHAVRSTRKIPRGQFNCFIDTLLTAPTVADAYRITQDRIARAEEG